METHDLVEGWTAPIDVYLLAGGAVPTGSMSGMSVELVLANRHGQIIQTAGDVSIQDTDNWVVRYTPSPGDLVASPYAYYGRFKVTDQVGGISYYPSGEPDEWKIRPVTI